MNPAFDVVFGVFVVLMVGLAVVAVRWAVQRDRAERVRRAAVREAEGGGVDAARRTTDSSHAPGADAARQTPAPGEPRTHSRRK